MITNQLIEKIHYFKIFKTLLNQLFINQSKLKKMEKLIINGNLGADARVNELRNSNGKVINFSVATSKNYVDKNGEKQTVTKWWDCSKFVREGGSTKLADFLKKGQNVTVCGEPNAEIYDTKDHRKAIALRLRVEDLSFGGGSVREKDDEVNENESEQQEMPVSDEFNN